MFCTTECWSCEDKNCEHYISKQELYFENQQLKEDNKTLRENYENGIKLLKQNKQLKSVLDEIREYINNYDVFKEFNFPLMKRDEENQVKSSIDYEFQTSIKKSLLQILDKVEYLC